MKSLDIYSKRILDLLSNLSSIEDASYSLRQFASFVWLDHPQKLSYRLEQLEDDWYIKKDENWIYAVIKNYINDFLNIPYYGWSQCWNINKSILEEKPKDFLQFDIELLWLNDNEDISNYFFTKAKWKSMLPRIKEDDLLLIRVEEYTPNNSNIYLVIHNGDAKIKKIQSKDDSTFLVSINESYDPFEIDIFNDSVKVVWTVKKIITSY